MCRIASARRRILKPFMQATQRQHAMLDGRFRVAQLQHLLAPKVRVKELRPAR